MSSSALLPVPFHGATLFLVEQNNEPYTPMKPIVEGMGLDWGGQHKKFSTDPSRWGCISLKGIQVPGDTQGRETLCIPLRKLPGWLMTIHPSRVKPEIREKILQYQNEFDDVLWAYWTKGRAENPRPVRQVRQESPLSSQEASTMLRREISNKLRTELAEPLHMTAEALLTKALTAYFRIGSIRQISPLRLEEALKFVRQYPLALTSSAPAVSSGNTPSTPDLDFPKDTARPSRPFWKDLPDNPGSLSIQDLLDPDYTDPIRQLLERIEKAGYDVQGPWSQYQAMKEHLRSAAKAFDEIYQIARARRLP